MKIYTVIVQTLILIILCFNYIASLDTAHTISQFKQAAAEVFSAVDASTQ